MRSKSFSHLCKLVGNVDSGMVAHNRFPIRSHTDLHITKTKTLEKY